MKNDFDSKMKPEQFHKIYIQRHDNVSIYTIFLHQFLETDNWCKIYYIIRILYRIFLYLDYIWLYINPERPIYFYPLAADCRQKGDIYVFW